MIPSIYQIMQREQFYTQCCSILIVKKDLIQKQNQQKEYQYPTQMPDQREYTQNDDVFLIKFRVGKYQTVINVDILYVEIDFYEKESDESKKNMIINELNYQLRLKQNLQNQANKIYQVLEGVNQNQKSDKLTAQISFYNQELNQQKKRKLTIQNAKDNQDEETQAQSIKGVIPSCLKCQRKLNRNSSKTPNFQKLQIECFSNLIHYQNKIQDKCSCGQKDFQASYIQQASLNQIEQNRKLQENSNTITKTKSQCQFQSFRNINEISFNTRKYVENIKNHVYDSKDIYYLNQQNSDLIQSDSLLLQNELDQIDLRQEENLIHQQNLYSNINSDKNERDINNYISQTKQNNYFSHFNQICDGEEFRSYTNSNSKDQKTGIKINKTSFCSTVGEESQRKEQKNETASVYSSKYSSININKRQTIKIIKQGFQKKQNLLILVGILSSLILTTLTILMHLSNKNSLNSFLNSFLKIDNTIYCFIDALEIISFINYKDILIILNYESQSEKINKEIEEIKEISTKFALNDYLYHMQQLFYSNDSVEQIQQLLDHPFDVYIHSTLKEEVADYKEQNYLEVNSTFSFKLQQTMMYYYFSISKCAKEYSIAEAKFFWRNLITFKDKMKNLQQIVESYSQNQLQNMNSNQTFTLIIFITISGILMLIIIFLSVFIQFQKEIIMKLSGSFQPTVLKHQIKMIELAIYKIDHINLTNQTDKIILASMQSLNNSKKALNNQQIKTQIKHALQENTNEQKNQSSKFIQKVDQGLQRYIPRLQNKRNRQIATFNSLPKLNWNILSMSIITMSVLLIQPFLNILKFKPYEREAKVSLEERIYLIDFYSILIENQALHYANMFMLLFQSIHPKQTFYYNYIQNVTENNSNSVRALSQKIQNFNVKRFKQDRFTEFYEGILNRDLCEVKDKYPQYFNSNISRSSCNTLYHGILKEGLLLTFKNTFDIYYQLYEIYSIEDRIELLNQFWIYDENNQVLKFYTLIKIISSSVNAIRKFQNEQLQEFHDLITQEFLYLFIIQLVIISILFMIGWVHLIKYFNSQINLTMKVFTLFHINLLLENKLIQDFFKKKLT